MGTLNLKINGFGSFECMGTAEFIAAEREKFNDFATRYMPQPFEPVAHEYQEEPMPDSKGALKYKLRKLEGYDYNIKDLLAQMQLGLLKFNVGDTIEIPLTDGTTDEFVMTQEDDEAYRFESVNCILGECITRDKADEAFEGYLDLLPGEIRDELLLTKRRYLNRDGEERERESLLFLPSAAEVFAPDDVYGDEGLYEQMEWYKDRRHRMRKLKAEDTDTISWWLISAYAGDTSIFCNVGNGGNANNAIASSTWVGLPVCFRIRKSK